MKPLVFGSVCSGIEAASVAWEPLGWESAFFAEIDPFPSSVLAHRFPGTPNLGDFTTIQRSSRPINLLVGGTPCQSFSVAGLRGGLADERGNLALEFLRLAGRLRPEWVVWENVPGVMSSWSDDPDCDPRDMEWYGPGDGRAQVVQQRNDFDCFLGGLAELGYGWAYRVLDAQYFGVPQRRRRVFVVGRAGDWRGAAAVLFERHSLSGDPTPSRETGPNIAGSLTSSLGRRCGVPDGGDTRGHLVARTLTAHPSGRFDGDTETFIPSVAFGLQSQAGRYESGSRVGNAWNTNYVAHTLRGEGFDASEDGTGRGTPLVLAPIDLRQTSRGDKDTNLRSRGSGGPPGVGCGHPGDPAFTVSERGQAVALAVQEDNQNGVTMRETAGTLRADAPGTQPCGSLVFQSAVRRLTPLECERLQGFPDHWTLVPYRGKPAADGPRYKAIGNSMAIPPMRWLGQRINAVRKVLEAKM